MEYLSVTPKLQLAIQQAINAVSPAHRLRPVEGEVVAEVKKARERIQDWAFTQLFAVAVLTETRGKRATFACVHHGFKTRNTRKTEEENRQRSGTAIQKMGCLFRLTVSYGSRAEQWAIHWPQKKAHHHHTHALGPDPFQYPAHWPRRPNNAATVQLATTHRGELTHSMSNRILRKSGVSLSKKEFYNLARKEKTGLLTKQEELVLLLECLEAEDDEEADEPGPSTRRSGRARQPTRKVESQQRRDVAATAEAEAQGAAKRARQAKKTQNLRNAALRHVSQLNEFKLAFRSSQ